MSLNGKDYWIKLNDLHGNGQSHTINLKDVKYFKKYDNGTTKCIEFYDYIDKCHDCWFGDDNERQKFIDFLNKYFNVKTVNESIEEYEQ